MATAKPKRLRKPVRIIIDSNAFLAQLQFKIDILEELRKLLKTNLEFILLEPIHRELETLAREGPPKMRKNASYALQLADKCKPVKVTEECTKPVDDVIIEMAQELKSPVFTNDRHLRRRLRNISVPVIYVRQKARLEIDGRIKIPV